MEHPLPDMTTAAGCTDQEQYMALRTILRALAYFDNFQHPLNLQDLARFGAGPSVGAAQMRRALGELVSRGMVHRVGDYWGLENVERAVEQRHAAEKRAHGRMPRALGMSERIARFPYVRAVFISGSLSKGCLAEDGDIDFFVITAPGRLWVARTLMVLYKKIFLLNSRKDFCVNYFIDTEHLTVEDRNRFTATEVVTLIPTYGNGTTETFFERNAWAFRMYPGACVPKSLEVTIGKATVKKALERILRGRVGDLLDSWCMRLTWHRWKRKFGHLDARTFELALRTRTYVSKHHPRNFQKRVLDGYDRRIQALETHLGMPLS